MSETAPASPAASSTPPVSVDSSAPPSDLADVLRAEEAARSQAFFRSFLFLALDIPKPKPPTATKLTPDGVLRGASVRVTVEGTNLSAVTGASDGLRLMSTDSPFTSLADCTSC